mgnify:CR=1 FL=1
MISIVDYGSGNLGSVQKALEHLGYPCQITDQSDEIMRATGLVLPGVGAFASGMQGLEKRGLDQVIKAYVDTGKPFLGICLGMQLLFDSSEEGGDKGLSLIPGEVRRFSSGLGLKIRQMGWSDIIQTSDSLFSKGEYMYFVHSYYCCPQNINDIAAKTEYGHAYACAVSRDNILAMQFHPEKSGEAGLAILNRWARRTR